MPLNLEKIRKLIGDKPQGEIAKAAKMGRTVLNRLLAGKVDPRIGTVERLAKALGVRAADLLK